MPEASLNIKQYDPAFRQSIPLTLDLIDTTGASSGDTVIYDGNTVVWQESGSLPLSLSITSVELRAMNASPITVISAPGVGKYIVVDRVVLKYNYGTIAYTQPGNTNLIMGNTSNSLANMGNTLNAGSSFTKTYNANSAATLYENTAVQLYNTVGELTNGNGTVQIYVYYSIASF